jgi:histidinol dehydrogenase
MRILDWNTLDRAARRAALARPELASRAEVAGVAQEVIDRVRHEGDAALFALTERFDGARLQSLTANRTEFDEARRALTPDQVTALKRAVTNLERFHEAQRSSALAVETEPGVHCEQILRPIAAVGLYAPAGSAPLPSAVLMVGVPARLAGCSQRVLCTPPRADGTAHPAILVAAQLCGIETVFKVGGAQAIAALAYGTQSIPRVDKIFGPGNAWVTAAKGLVSADPAGAACDLPAGPSEVLVIADQAARPEFVAADLLAQAEHDSLAQAILVTDSRALAIQVIRELEVQRATLSRAYILEQSLQACRCILVADLEAAVNVANEYAPEHLILQVREPRRWLAHVRNAGSVFLGAWSPEPLGDYCSGTNHVLPTYGHARALSGLTLADFVKTISVQELSAAGLRQLGPTAITLAQLEGLDAHAQAVARRLTVLARLRSKGSTPALSPTEVVL